MVSGLLLFASITQAQSDPYANLKKMATARDSVVQKRSAVVITPLSRVYKSYVRAAVPFQPIPMKDQQGRTVSPNKMMTLPSGRQVTATVYYAKLNEAKRKMNALGFAPANGTKLVTGEILTPASTLSGRVSILSKPVGKYKSPEELKLFLDHTVIK